MKDFVHLHLHSEYSLLDGACRIENLVRRVSELGQKAVAVTDHGVMNGAFEFCEAAKKNGIKPIVGCEVYVASGSLTDKGSGHGGDYNHLILLAQNKTGYHNLIKLVSLGWTEGYYYKPRIDEEILRQYSDGLICSSACLAGAVPQLILSGDMKAAYDKAAFYAEIFKDRYYLELQDHGIKEQQKVNEGLLLLSKQLGLPLICTNDAHYIEKKDAELQNILLCVQTGKTVEEGSGIGFETDEFYLKSTEEMTALFGGYDGALENTVKIAEECEFELSSQKVSLPSYPLEDGVDKKAHFRKICEDGLKKRYGSEAENHRRRLDYEISVIEKMGYVDYFLIVSDYVNYAKDHGIPVGPGRGSAAGSIVSYCLEITDIDPIRYGLLFERFLNPERVSMPDIDVDFCEHRRQEVINYVTEKYGRDRVVQIVTFGTMKARLAVRDVGRALGMSYQEVDAVAKQIPNDPQMKITIEKTLEMKDSDLSKMMADPRIAKLINTAKALEGMPRNISTHAAGVVMADKPVSEYVPLMLSKDATVTQFAMGTLEKLGLLKMDFLGLRNLTVIDNAVREIRKNVPDFDIRKIPFDDAATYDMLSQGQTRGVFQLEQPGMTRTVMSFKPTVLEDIIAIIALYRPGPMDSIPRYIENRLHPDKITYKHPLLKDILDITYGCIVYQEQVMQIVQKLAGYSYGRADLVRRAMAKKKPDVLSAERKNFIEGIVLEDGTVSVPGTRRNGISDDIANSIFDEMISFADYAFNKSHAAAYACLSYQTAYLKRHFMKEYYAALMTSVLENADKIMLYADDCKRFGINLLPPDVNESDKSFSVSGDNIRFGLAAIKSVGEIFAEKVIFERQNGGRYSDFYDFCSRLSGYELNSKNIEALIMSGAFDSLPQNRRQLAENYLMIIGDIADNSRNNVEGQLDLFGNENAVAKIEWQDVPDWPLEKRLSLEKEYTGLFLSGHPMDEYRYDASRYNRFPIGEIIESFSEEDGGEETGDFRDGQTITVCGIITALTVKITKNGGKMAIIRVEDSDGSMECLIFPKLYEKNFAAVNIGAALAVSGELSVKENEPPKILTSGVIPLKKNDSVPKPKRLYIKVDSTEDESYKAVVSALDKSDGADEAVFVVGDGEGRKKYLFRKKVSADSGLIQALTSLLGESRIVVIDR